VTVGEYFVVNCISQCAQDPTRLNLDSDRWDDVNVVISLLKTFFRKLPEPLVTSGNWLLSSVMIYAPDFAVKTWKFKAGTLCKHSFIHLLKKSFGLSLLCYSRYS